MIHLCMIIVWMDQFGKRFFPGHFVYANQKELEEYRKEI